MAGKIQSIAKRQTYRRLESSSIFEDVELEPYPSHGPITPAPPPEISIPVHILPSEQLNRPLFIYEFSGWRGGLARSICAVGIVLLINLIFLNWACFKFGLAHSKGVFYRGDCETVDRLIMVAHLVINVLGTFLLGASNYGMQVLAAPTRDEVDEAHKRNSWLDIGAPSVRNFRYIDKRRAALWLVMGFSSIPLHLMYNSAVFASFAVNEYEVLIVTEDFVTLPNNSSMLNTSDPLEIQLKEKATNGSLLRRHTIDCIQDYDTRFQSKYRNLLAVTEQNDTEKAVLKRTGLRTVYTGGRDDWLCFEDAWNRCDTSEAKKNATTTGWILFNYKISYCLAEKGAPDMCSLNFSMTILIVVITANAAKLMAMIAMLKIFDTPTLVTLGDAVASFLERPCTVAGGLALYSGRCVSKRSVQPEWKFRPRAYSSTQYPRRWFNAPSKRKWAISISLVLGVLMGMIIGFTEGLKTLDREDVGIHFKGLWTIGFGAILPDSIVKLNLGEKPSTVLLIVIANCPQLALSLCYVMINQLLSNMSASREWANFAHVRKGLRVTRPRGHQRSTYYLQLPYVLSIPLLVLSVSMHYLVSQSLFLVNITIYDEFGDKSDYGLHTLGFSAIAIFFVIVVSALALLVVVCLGFISNKPGIPPAGFCSAAIAAACHPPPGEDNVDAALKPVQWGDVMADEEVLLDDGTKGLVGHCSFSAGEVRFPTERKLYR
ncbi:uncharacterized protein K452DRAFT_308025 [Aplosporella prunicola CBS 121167]|uniref:DUF6536 domain-containing protein n=1 Tax=Aplosporella prunicola CBS 121167 TaxID=1176127 RepID=A0A6A6BIE4_9PEZI|nr:uncharacterized protein K452DRAFT_308025 [Aplosporella prunicola CBS 121167]KAF2142331.1 hypothetical protein K452DRAFT_308025 [Aplosporella prunicola CBS 121167]